MSLFFPKIIRQKVITRNLTLCATKDLKGFFFINHKEKDRRSIIYSSEESADKAHEENKIEWSHS